MHVRRHGDGWRVIVQHAGRKRSAVARTKAEAQRKGAELLLEMGTTNQPATTTLTELITLHINQTQLAATTRADYLSIRDKLPDWMGEWPVHTITPHMIDQAYTRLTRDGWTTHRIKRLHTILRPAFQRAARYGWITTNPALSAQPPAVPANHIHAPTPADINRLLTTADRYDPNFGCALRVAAATGIRRGELCALQWADIDLTTGELTVQRSIATIAGTPHIITEGKTGSKGHRTIALDPFTIAALTAHRARQAAFLLNKKLGRTPWVFTHDAANPWRADYPTRTYNRVRTQAGLPDIRLHDLRHFAATQLLGASIDIRTVAGRLGHARPSTTLNKYSSFLPARDRDAANILGNLLNTKAET